MRDVMILVERQSASCAAVNDDTDFSLPPTGIEYGIPTNRALSASTCTRPSALSSRCRSAERIWSRTNSMSGASSVPAVSRSAQIAHVLSNVERTPRNPNSVQSSLGATTIVLPSAAIFVRIASCE